MLTKSLVGVRFITDRTLVNVNIVKYQFHMTCTNLSNPTLAGRKHTC